MTRLINLLIAAWSVTAGAKADMMNLKWERLPPLPPAVSQVKQPGVAGPFAGVHHDALIVAGGANFPDKLPWDGGAKFWWDDIFVLEKLSDANPRWVSETTFKLPRPIGYGVSVDTPDGVICAGGQDAQRCYADVFMLSWDVASRTVRRTELPPLPEPLSFMAGALVDDVLYVAGGQTTMQGAVPSSVFWRLDLSQRGHPAEFKWQVLPGWPGPPRVLAVAAAQRGADGMEFYLFSGRTPEAGKLTRILSDAYAFNPRSRTWRTLPVIGDGVRSGVSVMAGTAAAVGADEIFLFGGDRGDLFQDLDAHDLAIAELQRQLAAAKLESKRQEVERLMEVRLAEKKEIYRTHPGFAREVLAFNTRRNTWRIVGRAPFPSQVTTVAVKHDDSIVIPSGEIKPGIRTSDIVRVKLETKK